jgi:NCS2 family nucleobase:cation symporter-2
MATKYEYGVNEVPPFRHLLVLSLQHVMLMFVSIAFPVIFAGQINASVEFTAALITFSMLASGFGSIMQSVRWPFLGSGYLCPNVCGPSYFSLSLSAAWTGGMPLMRGMIIVAGLVEVVLAPVVQKLKQVFPNYIVGLVVALVGVSVITPSVTSLFGLAYRGDAIGGGSVLVGFFSLAVMVLCNVWGKGLVRMYCLLIGMLAGWTAALLCLPESRLALAALHGQAWFAWPRMPWRLWNLAFDARMAIPFVVIGISGSLKSFGNLLAAQRISEPHLETPNFKPLRNGLMADGLSTVLAGVLGGLAVDTSSSNVGLAGSTRVLSRWLAMAAGVIFILLSFSPILTTLFSLMPKPVLGASIVFAACFMLVTGLQQMFEEKWEARRTFVVGIALSLGLSTAFLPTLYARAPYVVRTFFTDPLPTATLLAVVINQVVNLDRTLAGLRLRRAQRRATAATTPQKDTPCPPN